MATAQPQPTRHSPSRIQPGRGSRCGQPNASLAASYAVVSNRNASHSNFPPGAPTDVTLPNEIHLDGGLNIPQGWWKATNWISEANAIVYTGGDRKPKTPIFLVTGLRHWFGASGWALNLAARWNDGDVFGHYRDYSASPPEPCAGCEYFEVCRGGCRIVAKFVTGDPRAPDPECPRVIDARLAMPPSRALPVLG